MQTLTIIQPDDMHLHLRDGEMLKAVLPYTAKQMGRAVVMPNLKSPIVSVKDALEYKQRILKALPEASDFEPLMTLYLTDTTTPEMVRQAKDSGIVGFKLYPAGATTNSDSGVTDLFKLSKTLEAMVDCQMPLLVHGEVTSPSVDIFDRESVFIDKILVPLVKRFPTLKIVFEHITTREAAQYIESTGDNIVATITPQHLLFNRNDMLVGGLRPHFYCLPILKRNIHQKALLNAITGEFSRYFFLGTDSAPHVQGMKESACGCAGCFSACSAIELYANIFDEIGALDKLEAFTSVNGAKFYEKEINKKTTLLVKKFQRIPEKIIINDDVIIPLWAGKTLRWMVSH